MTEKRIYLPYMCDHAYAMAAAMRHYGLPAQVMAEPDAESMRIGKALCLGKECLPCFTCIGDIVKQSREPGFDAARAVLFMPTTAGPCRFGQYRALLRILLDEQGLDAIEIMSPTAENSYQGFGEHPVKLRLLIWRGAVGVDLLQKLRHEHRPYEVNVGETDALYRACLTELCEALEAGGAREAVAAMRQAAARFQALSIRREERRPIIGMVGEIYLRHNPFTNQEIARQVEALGGEVWVATLMEWFYFTNLGALNRARAGGKIVELLKTRATDGIQERIEREMLAPVAPLLRNAHETPIAEVVANDAPYYDPDLGTEAALSIGKAIDFARMGVSGILNILPFSCMPGTTVAGLSAAIRRDHDAIPWLDVMYDDQEATNVTTRLEAFMYQARQYRRRMKMVHAMGS